MAGDLRRGAVGADVVRVRGSREIWHEGDGDVRERERGGAGGIDETTMSDDREQTDGWID